MKCESCREREAVVHLTQIVNDAVSQLHLCEVCAGERGVEPPMVSQSPLGSFLAAMGKGPGTAEGPLVSAPRQCPGCGATLQDFRETGRLGCPECYECFEAPLRDLLRRLHGSAVHAGERYLEPGADPRRQDQAAEVLRAELRKAVAAENFELAAELRDRLRAME
jgi:protein arginine kinase activator